MSWSRRRLTATALLALGGCGFEPVYARRDAEAPLQSDLAAIELPDARSELTFKVRTAVLDQLNPTRASVPTRFRLDWQLARRISSLIIQLDGVVTRRDYALAATYALIDLGENAVVDRGRVERIASFNVTRDPYNDLVAREDAERRAAQALAVALRQQLTAYFEREAV